MSQYPIGNWFEPRAGRVSPAPDTYSLFHRMILWRIRKEANSTVNLNVFRVFIRLGNIFFKYVLFMAWVMRHGKIPRVDKEIVILRVAWRMGCKYEWAHHIKIGEVLGLTRADMNSVAEDSSGDWTDYRRVLIQATDDLLSLKNISEKTWQELREHLSEDQIVEFCMLVGHYIMVAISINTLGICIEPQFDLDRN